MGRAGPLLRRASDVAGFERLGMSPGQSIAEVWTQSRSIVDDSLSSAAAQMSGRTPQALRGIRECYRVSLRMGVESVERAR